MTCDAPSDALQRLDALIEEMSRPLLLRQRVRGWHEGNGGWTEDSRKDWLRAFRELRRRVAAREGVDDEARHLLRWLDGRASWADPGSRPRPRSRTTCGGSSTGRDER
jgi:hypothetical protein